MNQSEQILGTEPIGKLLIKYSVPAIIGMVVNGLYNVVDRIFIGNIPGVGPLAIAGVGVTMPIMTIILAFGMLIGIGTVTSVSIKLGQGKKEEAEKLIGNAIALSVIIGLIISVVGLLFGDQILQSFGASPESLEYAKAYINIILMGCIFNIIAFVMNCSIRGDGNPKLAAIIMIVGCGTNIILDALFIFGLNMGIQGAALATVISQILTAVWGLAYYMKGKSNLKFAKSSLRLEKKLVKEIVAIGCAPFAMQIAASLIQVISNNALRVHGGDLGIAAMATITSIAMMLLMPIGGLTQGAQPIIGYNYGAEKYDRATKTFNICLLIATIALGIAWVFIQTFPEAVVSLFSSDPELVNITVNGLKKYLVVLFLVGIPYMGANYMQSIGKAKEAMLLSLLRQVIILIPIVLILPNFMGLDGVWFAQPIADIIATVVTVIVVRREFKSYKKLINNQKEQVQI
ncbi:MAG: MATE family efflux transporter [Cellulosilyticaceae bacterium]